MNEKGRWLRACGDERVNFETSRAACGSRASMKYLAHARYRAEKAGATLGEIDAAELRALDAQDGAK